MANILKVYLWPKWLVQIFTSTKSFQKNPFIGSFILNLLGLHIIRILFSNLTTSVRWLFLRGKIPSDLRNKFHRDGYLAVENLISEKEVEALKVEIAAYQDDARQLREGDTYIQRILIDSSALEGLPTLAPIVHDEHMLGILAYGGASATRMPIFLERLRHGTTNAADDPQKTLHSDTFHSTMKAWLFLEEVTEDDGPFSYVPGSQRLSWRRLKWEYFYSLRAAKMTDGHSEDGSFRAQAEDLRAMGLPDPVKFTVKAGTLVMADTNGFHRRSDAKEGTSRFALWTKCRPNPFAIWPGSSNVSTWHHKNKLRQATWERLDKAAKAKGEKSGFYKIAPKKLLG